MVFAVFVLAGACAAQSAPGSLPPSPEQQLFRLLSLERHHHGLGLLEWNDHLAEAARVHAQKMARAGDISHRFSGEPDLSQRAGAAGALFKAVAENVALAGTPEEIHLALMNSPGHRANILNAQYNAVGVGVVQVKDELFVTEDFAQVVPSYSADQFRQGVVEAFNKLRRARGIRAIASRSDTRLDQAACSGRLDPGSALAELPGASSATTFTAVEPGDLPAEMQKSAADSTLQRMSLGVCFRPNPANSFAEFWVVAVFFSPHQERTTGPLLPVTR
jgi:uncharacterized protein YkwD